MSYFIIEGQQRLNGNFYPKGNKNESFPILSAILLTKDKIIVRNIPYIADVIYMIDILRSLKVKVRELSKHDFEFDASKLSIKDMDIQKIKKLRGSLTLIGTLLYRFSEFYFPEPGGDRIGIRKLDTILIALKEFGTSISYNPETQLYKFIAPKTYLGKDILLCEASVTGTSNLILLSVLSKGKTIIRNAASEPHIQGLCHFLNSLGAKIHGIGTNQLSIEGVLSLKKQKEAHKIASDYIEIASIIGLAAITNSELYIHNVIKKDILMILYIYEKLGIHVIYKNETTLMVPKDQKKIIMKDLHHRIEKISDGPWPNLSPDIMSIIIVLATQCQGNILIHEKMFESRLYFVDMLLLMGANIILCDPHRAIIFGHSQLFARELNSPDIRAGIALLIAACTAKGTSILHHAEQIDRGYENIEVRLNELGTKIKRIAS